MKSKKELLATVSDSTKLPPVLVPSMAGIDALVNCGYFFSLKRPIYSAAVTVEIVADIAANCT